jgi:uncharacterized lipoprotein YehR (DUF1307 family)
MKKTVLFILCVILLAACGGKTEKKTAGGDAATTENVYISVDSLLNVVENFVDQPIKVKGFVTHTCSHSGKRCFITGDDQGASFRIEAGGVIERFDASLVGSEIEVDGIVREYRLEKEKIDESEAKLEDAKTSGEKSGEHCESEMQNIQQMRAWMQERGLDYYAIYYIDGEKYQVVD